tara:strand:- start:21639 stop:23231 length:1593 start_codon:yes stop_codon:yes gene_type:complete
LLSIEKRFAEPCHTFTRISVFAMLCNIFMMGASSHIAFENHGRWKSQSKTDVGAEKCVMPVSRAIAVIVFFTGIILSEQSSKRVLAQGTKTAPHAEVSVKLKRSLARFKDARDELVRMRVEKAGVTNPRVLDAIRNTPRHEFVPEHLREQAYLDMALPIGDSQTISSPFIVALMTEVLDPQPTDKVLEVGTGSGYQAAVLSPLVQHVYSIEIVPELGQQAAKVLKRLDYKNVSTRIGDGYLGWPEAAPLDKIIVTCSPESVPQPLIDQLREGGKMIIPVGQRYQQTLFEMTKQNGKLIRKPLRPTLFVPMTGEAEESRQLQPDRKNPVVVNGDFEAVPEHIAASIDDARDTAESIDADQSKTNSPSSDHSTSDRLDQKYRQEYIAGWYYGRQVRRVKDSAGTGAATNFAGNAFARFENTTPGLDSHLLQGIPIDGTHVGMLRMSGRVRTENVQQGPGPQARPVIAISFYDRDRNELGIYWLGPFSGTTPWRNVSRLVRVPAKTHEAILRIGLFGATGRADFDAISLKRVD